MWSYRLLPKKRLLALSAFAIKQTLNIFLNFLSFPVAQIVEHGASNAKIMGLIPRESKSW